MSTIPCSVGILTFNSARTLRRALQSVKEFDDIVICDGGSTDGTLALAEEYGALVLAQDAAFKNADGTLRDYSGVRNQCLAAARHAWFLYIYSDEVASVALVEEIRRIVSGASPCAAYRIPERMVLAGRLIEHSSNYPGYQYRFLRTDKGTQFEKTVHERPVFKEPPPAPCTLAGPWYVFWDEHDVAHYGDRVRRYVELERARSRGMGWRAYVTSFLPRNLKSMLGVLLRTVYNRLRYPAETCMPLSIEWGRIRYHARLLFVVGRSALSKPL